MNAPFYFIDDGRHQIVFCDSPDEEMLACDGRALTLRSIVPVLRFDANGTKVSVFDSSTFGTAAMPPSQRPIIV